MTDRVALDAPLDQARGLHVVTLGTAAGPAIRSECPGIATAIVVDGRFYLVDFGLGVTRAAHAAGLRGENLKACFVTHLHSDHVAEIPAYLLWNWGRPVQGFTEPVQILGPGPADPRAGTVGTAGLVEHVLQAYSYDIDVRIVDEGRPPLYDLVQVEEIELPATAAGADGEHTPQMDPFMVYEDEFVRVSAILVEHPPIFPAFAFRFDTAYGSVVVSGDTTESLNTSKLASGADLLVHEAVNLDFYRARDFGPEFLNHQEISHTTPAGVGRVATRAGATRVVLSHLAGVATDAEWTAGVATEYAGPVSVARPGEVYTVVPAEAPATSPA
ncbi:UNVERIFIED_CONTAM: MBL fold metallo-hydrolase [Kocuria sp. CPCC 205316]|uniref:MBL fold metallo-hydrolase n=1 Tax=Kocuria TaxID=57493 RepID=UPI0036DB439B